VDHSATKAAATSEVNMRGGPRYGRTNREVGQYRMKRCRRLVGFCTRSSRVRDACSGMRRALVRL